MVVTPVVCNASLLRFVGPRMSAVADQAAVKEYISKYQLEDELSAAVNMAIKANSDNPFKLISDYLKTLADPFAFVVYFDTSQRYLGFIKNMTRTGLRTTLPWAAGSKDFQPRQQRTPAAGAPCGRFFPNIYFQRTNAPQLRQLENGKIPSLGGCLPRKREAWDFWYKVYYYASHCVACRCLALYFPFSSLSFIYISFIPPQATQQSASRPHAHLCSVHVTVVCGLPARGAACEGRDLAGGWAQGHRRKAGRAD